MTTSSPQHALVPLERARHDERSALVRGLRLGRIAGIEIRLDPSVIMIATLVAFNLGAGLLPATRPSWSPLLSWSVAIVAALLLFASILAHELSHALVGRRFGLPTDRITLFIFGGMAELRREPDRPKVELLTAIAGPVTSLVIGVVSTVAGSLIGQAELGKPLTMSNLQELGPVSTLLLWLGPINVMLGLFNLVPGFPLDGGRVFRAILWWKTKNLMLATRWASRGGQAVALALVLIGVTMMFGYHVPFFGVGFGSGLWLVLIGWFLNSAAVRSYEQLVSHEVLSNVPVSKLMLSRFESVPGSMAASALEDEFLHTDQRCYPVVEGGLFEGLVCLDDLRRLPQEEWVRTPVRGIMTPVSRLAVVRPDSPASEALRLLAEHDVDQLPVIDGQRLIGLVRRRDLMRWLTLKTGQAASREITA